MSPSTFLVFLAVCLVMLTAVYAQHGMYIRVKKIEFPCLEFGLSVDDMFLFLSRWAPLWRS